MYRPLKYQKDDKKFLLDFMEEHPFASFITRGEHLLATHIPVLVERQGENLRLYSHIAKHNEQADFLENGAEALVVFQGPHAYVSSSWYKKKDISTWDYSAVHVNARIKLQTQQELEDSLRNLVKKFEKHQDRPLYYDEIPRGMVEEHLPLIRGFWLEPIKMQGVAKWHQSYDREDVRSVVRHLDAGCPMDRELSRDVKKENRID